jgi:dihydrolipoamide dehydrogenase
MAPTVPVRTVDVAILGSGTAGLNARRAAEKEGRTALMIDPGPHGTTCARVGCMPSKLLIAAADAVHHAGQGGVFGFDAEVRVDGRRVMERVRRERDRFVGFVLESIDEHLTEERLVEGWGRVIGPHRLAVSHDRAGEKVFLHVDFKALVLATGSSPWVPPPYRELGPLLLDNEGVFELEDLPQSLLVVGPGVIGLELGQAMHRLGVRTTIVGVGGLIGPLHDPQMRAHAERIFGEELDLHSDIQDVRFTVEDGLAHVVFTDPDGTVHSGRFSRVLVAAGRRANIMDLGLEHAGVEVSERGRVDYDPRTMRIGDTHVYIAGDVNSDRPLLHEASDEGRIAGENAAQHPHLTVHRRRTSLGVVFSDPQIATVGEAWHAHPCDQNGVGEVSYSNQGRARVMNRNKGHVRIYGEAGSGRITGAEMIGPDVEHTAHLLAWAIQQGMTVAQALQMPFYHPVVEEGIRTALRDLRHSLHLPRPDGHRCDDFGPGE